MDDAARGPDPTPLATEQLRRATEAERDYVNGQLEVLRERLAGIDEATKLRLSGIEGIPTQIDQKTDHLRELNDERFRSISLQFKERDERSARESRDNKVAVDAAFAAQKEAAAKQNESNSLAISKSEAQTQEAIAKLGELFRSTTDGLADKIDEVKERLGRIESVKEGGRQAYAGVYAALGGLTALLAIIGAVVASRS